ncbi:MAG: hypothetical protein LBW85_05070 [Deltaproteobacteria bacterium]|nr:hypothetical protein [Deltaproteobacteria bacterium]
MTDLTRSILGNTCPWAAAFCSCLPAAGGLFFGGALNPSRPTCSEPVFLESPQAAW